jgi:hypothetical protein
MTAGLSIHYRPPGPVAAAFYRDRAPVTGIMGPVGSGKTGASLMRMVAIARAMRPSPIDGVRRAKFAVIRDTYRNLEATTIPSWHAWVPPTVGQWTSGAPAEHRIVFDDGQGVIELIVEFIALGEMRVEDVMRGWEGTGAYLNEADRLNPDVLTFVRGRVGRYPAARHGGCSWSGVWCDFNAPDTDNWTYATFVEGRAAGVTFYVQPGGRDPGAENLANLPPDYYARQSVGAPQWYVDRMVDNKFGYSRDGKPVYREYNDKVHCAAHDLEPLPGCDLIIGADAGGSPAASIWQRAPDGQWRGLDELVALQGEVMGPKRFGEELNRLLRARFAAFKPEHIRGVGDPSAAYGNDKKAEEMAWLEVLSTATGIRFRPAPTNKLTLRLEAVRLPLSRFIDGRPALLISPRMKFIRKGFNSHYRYRRVQTGEGRYHDEPEKNQWSHPHDSAQYVMVSEGEHLEVLGRRRHRAGAPRQTHAITDDEPRGVYGGRQTEAMQ